MKTTFLFLRPRDAALQSSRTSGTQLGPQRPSVRLYIKPTPLTGPVAPRTHSAQRPQRPKRCAPPAKNAQIRCAVFASGLNSLQTHRVFQIVATTHRIGTGRSLMGIHTRLPDTRGISHISHHRVPHGPLQECHPLICHASMRDRSHFERNGVRETRHSYLWRGLVRRRQIRRGHRRHHHVSLRGLNVVDPGLARLHSLARWRLRPCTHT